LSIGRNGHGCRVPIVRDTTAVASSNVAYLGVALFSTFAGVGSLAFLPPNIGATLCYFFALLPILFLGIGSTAPVLIANAIAAIKGKGDGDSSSASIPQDERRCRHEAAHFCCGYWCGLPVASYSVDQGLAKVEFGVASESYANTEMAALSITALSGLVGEALQWPNNPSAGSATEDLMVLDAVFRRSREFIGAAAQQDLTRWGALTAALLLRENSVQYEKVVAAFQRQASLEECIAILES
jgi:hypothetical protein